MCVYVNSCLLVMLIQPRTKHRLPHWIVGAISLAYTRDGLQLAHSVSVHSTMGMATSWAFFFKGVFVSDTCPVASWSSPRTFVQFYLLDATAPLVAPSAPSQQHTSALSRDSSLVVALPGCIMCCTKWMDWRNKLLWLELLFHEGEQPCTTLGYPARHLGWLKSG